jgi:photosystem II stability/assembly factor-like uncharacterized protein
LVSSDFGKTWESATENLPEDIQVSFIEQKGSEMVLASDNKGIFISSENKSKWNSIGDKLPDTKINALLVSGEIIYAGVYRQGIYKTTNEGKTWKSLNYNLQNLNVQSILKLDEQLLIGTDEGVFILDDNTKLWKETNLKSQVLSIYEYDGKLVAGTSQGTSISINKGNHWEWIRKEGSVHYTHNIGQRIIELVLNGDVVYSDDWGENWNQTQYEPRKGSYVYEIIESKEYQLISNNYGIHRSSDKGKTWEHIFKTESIAFFDLISIGDKIYGGKRVWDEYRKR